ncbi:MAG: bifunctional YncE family protein/alkaline phosphatase family protein, partial [Deltaproteobacteria bacterium]|nr:bifunctional YncE family protein/alkaline phosphatase family protein [Deltaproteobacteria bacterium]
MRKILLAQIIFLFFGCGDPAGENAYKINKIVEICSPAGITAEALLKAGKVAEEEYILPNGRRLTPAGDLIALGQFPLGLALDQSEKFAYIVPNDDKNNSLVVIDLNEKKIIQTVKGMRTFRGVAVSPDNQYLYVGGASSGTLHRFTIGQTGEVSDQKNYFLGGYIAALAIPPDGGYIYAVSNTNSKVFKFSAADEEVVSVFKAGQFPYDAVLSKDGKKLFISNLAAGTVLGLDTESGNALFEIKVGKNPQVMVLNKSGALLFVANSDSDTVSVIDLAQEKVVNTIDLTGNPFFFKAGSVNGLAVTADDKYLLATHAMMNKIEIVDLADFKPKGDIPAGWYPTEVKVTKEGPEILALSSKGFGSIGDLDNIPGFLQIIAFPDDAALAAYSATVKANNERAEKFFEEICSPETIPALSGKDSPIKHVVLIVRENKTYDMVLGDFERGDGDPSLTLFGKDITKNLHKIAEEFVNMDNFYSNPENSLQGHLWTTQK